MDGVFSYSGDAGTRTLQISATRKIQDRENGYDVFMDIDTSTGGKRNLFETVHGIIASLEANTPDGTYLDDLDLIQDHVADIRTRGGARLNSIDEQKSVNDEFILTLQSALSNTEDLDLAEAVSRFEQELVALQAAQQSFNMVQGLSLFNYL
jgi:flagellar hook-associated protein 3 FlgL